jgi:hypothetical protein
LVLADVLTMPRRTYSTILGQSRYVYWDSVATRDRASAHAYYWLLKDCGLLKEPAGGLDFERLDNAATLRCWSSDFDHGALFRCKLIHKLARGDMVFLNNLTWAHSVNNWSPESGVREVSAAFA